MAWPKLALPSSTLPLRICIAPRSRSQRRDECRVALVAAALGDARSASFFTAAGVVDVEAVLLDRLLLERLGVLLGLGVGASAGTATRLAMASSQTQEAGAAREAVGTGSRTSDASRAARA